MTVRISKLFGMDIYTTNADYKGKVFDLVINLEKGKIETITTEALKARSKAEAKKIISEKSIPYNRVRSAKDIVIVGSTARPEPEAEEPKSTGRPSARRY
ncbi:MAG: PRC-barrel domain-containing protein [archaeon]|nr:PRC-barrel domain-containing protein [archaeon]